MAVQMEVPRFMSNMVTRHTQLLTITATVNSKFASDSPPVAESDLLPLLARRSLHQCTTGNTSLDHPMDTAQKCPLGGGG